MKVKDKYGFLPTSIWVIKKDKNLMNQIDDILAKNSNGVLSEFNPTIAEMIIKYWSNKDELIVDPFCGRATRGIVAKTLYRSYKGFDISPKICKINNDRLTNQQNLFQSDNKNTIEIFNSDGTELKEIENNTADLVFSCPPYWNVEDYNKMYEENVEGQLSDIQDYNIFLLFMDKTAKNCYRVLKQNKFCVMVVNDIRRRKLIPFHSDMITSFIKSGFVLWDIIINELFGRAIMGIGNADENKYTAKIHEYILVFKKE